MRLFFICILFSINVYSVFSQDWEQCDGLYGAEINIIEVTRDNLLFGVNRYSGIMFRSSNDGNTWERLPKLEHAERYVHEINVVCSNQKTIYIGTDLGVFATDDNGNSWQLVGLENFKIESMVIKKDVLFCTTSNGYVFHSKDSGNTWTKIYENVSPYGSKIVFNNNTIYIVDTKLHQSTDNGTTWHIIDDSVLKSAQNGFLTNTIATSNGNVYAGAIGALFRSTDDGLSWSNLIDVQAEPLWDYNTWVRSVYAVGDTIYVTTGSEVLRSYDRGEQWYLSPVEGVPNTILHHKSKIYIGTFAGFSISEDNGFEWEEKNKGINYVVINSLIETGGVLLAGSNQGISRSTDNGKNWSYVKKGFTREYGQNLLKNKIYTFAMETRSMKRSKDNGISWEEIGPFKSDDYSENDILRSATIQNEKLFITTKDRDTLFVKEDNNKEWKKIPLEMNLYILTSDHKYIYATTTSHPQKLIRTEDGGENWEDFNIKNVSTYSALVVSNDAMFAIASNLLLRSTDEGSSWEDIGKNYGLVNPRIMAYSNGVLCIGTNKGIFVSNDKGSTWEMYYFEYPVTCILLAQSNLFVGTNTFSLWKYPFETLSLNDENTARNKVLNIHPNPVSNKCTVELSNFNGIGFANIYDIYGQLLLKQKLESKETVIDVSAMPIGEYNIVVSSGGDVANDKIIIMR